MGSMTFMPRAVEVLQYPGLFRVKINYILPTDIPKSNNVFWDVSSCLHLKNLLQPGHLLMDISIWFLFWFWITNIATAIELFKDKIHWCSPLFSFHFIHFIHISTNQCRQQNGYLKKMSSLVIYRNINKWYILLYIL